VHDAYIESQPLISDPTAIQPFTKKLSRASLKHALKSCKKTPAFPFLSPYSPGYLFDSPSSSLDSDGPGSPAVVGRPADATRPADAGRPADASRPARSFLAVVGRPADAARPSVRVNGHGVSQWSRREVSTPSHASIGGQWRDVHTATYLLFLVQLRAREGWYRAPTRFRTAIDTKLCLPSCRRIRGSFLDCKWVARCRSKRCAAASGAAGRRTRGAAPGRWPTSSRSSPPRWLAQPR
jgi:hypothetical protein